MRRQRVKRAAIVLVVLLGGVLVYGGVTFWQVRQAAEADETAAADAIVVLGAAQYNGRPSPVFKARLDHALDLFDQGYANIVITTGGYGPDPNFSEAHVGAEYLAEHGIDRSQIVIQQASGTTLDTVIAAARHMNASGWKRAIAVSDGFHLYRLKEIFADNGIQILASPAPRSRIEASPANRVWFSLREVVLISAYRLSRLFA